MTTEFTITGDLPDDSLVIQASAGTGKTYSLAALATRLVAEQGLRASELLVVTFTRAATAELRERLRERIVGAARLLDRLEAGTIDPDGAAEDPLHEHLAGLPNRARVAGDLHRAAAEFDTATISTIHGFATQALSLLGLDEGDDGGLTGDGDDLVSAICADVYAAAATRDDLAPHLGSFGDFRDLVRIVLSRPGIRVTPEPDEAVVGPDLLEPARVVNRLLDEVRTQVRDQRRRLGHRSFDDILTTLRDQLVADRSGSVAALVRSRFRAALIDEFQDTDPVQWDIFRLVFGDDAAARLVLVGDPKQAIYSFRGADVHTYLDAVRGRPDTRSLTTNWRSDGAALAAVDTIFDGVTFGDPDIGFTPVSPADGHRGRRLVDVDGGPLPGLSIRHRSNLDIPVVKKPVAGEHHIQASAGRREVYRDLAGTLVDLFETARIPAGRTDDEADADGERLRPVRPSDVAVLVDKQKDGEAIRQVLLEHGIPAVLSRGRSVLQSPAAEQWRWLLEAVARPADHRRARLFALGWFGGLDARELDAATDEQLASLQEQLWTWSAVLGDRGPEAFLRRVLDDTDVVARVLATPDGDRDATDLDHVAELLRTERRQEHVGIAGLLDLLREDRIEADPNAEFEGDPTSRRVASEADAVQIMTIWVAKGLEFPIVCCPTLWVAGRNSGPTVYLDDDGRSVDALHKLAWPDKAEQKRRTDSGKAEREGERLRLLYVALTRARHQTILWWVRGHNSQGTVLARVLFGRDGAGAIDPGHLPDGVTAGRNPKLPSEDDCEAGLRRLAARADTATDLDAPVMEVVRLDSVSRRAPWTPPEDGGDGADLRIARLDHLPPRLHARWSFSAIASRAADVDEPASPDTVDPLVDEPEAPEPAEVEPPDPAELRARLARPGISPLAPLPAGAPFGLLVHALYEHVDFQDDDLPAAIADRIGAELSWRSVDLRPPFLPDADRSEGPRRLVEGVAASLRTPLGADLGDLRLVDLPRTDRLDELDFDLHLRSGTDPVTDRDLGRVVLAHLDADDPFRPWAEGVAAGAFDVQLAGHLTGSIDLVLRWRRDGEPDRFVVCDYKTNRLHDPHREPQPDDYGPDRLVGAMAEAHYPLQALLYAVAVHRHLRWRLPGYDPEVHLGGIAYLFVRGMAGPDTARTDRRTHGVCRWNPPARLIVALSDLLAGAPVDPLLEEAAR